EQIIETGAVTRGWFGVDVAPVSGELAESLGLKDSRGPIVGGIERGSPAEKSGIKLGDVIVSVDGKPTPDVPTALNLIAEMQPGKTVPVNVVRRGQQLSLEVVVGKRRPRPRNTED
ncbi:MAG TPA: PDZ domain-containing protein, partial [Usitatibacter sp.]|nr:PDZ domain-containing protein [Usitatibacter sp.]